MESEPSIDKELNNFLIETASMDYDINEMIATERKARQELLEEVLFITAYNDIPLPLGLDHQNLTIDFIEEVYMSSRSSTPEIADFSSLIISLINLREMIIESEQDHPVKVPYLVSSAEELIVEIIYPLEKLGEHGRDSEEVSQWISVLSQVTGLDISFDPDKNSDVFTARTLQRTKKDMTIATEIIFARFGMRSQLEENLIDLYGYRDDMSKVTSQILLNACNKAIALISKRNNYDQLPFGVLGNTFISEEDYREMIKQYTTYFVSLVENPGDDILNLREVLDED
jgi:hypothetical protein